jgi:acyl-CoA thioesterase FadM
VNGRDYAGMSSQKIAFAPSGAFVQSTRVRSYEVGRAGCIGLGTILRYFEGLATEASAARGFDFRWYEDHNAAWVVREMNLLVGALPGIGEELTLATWVSDFRRVQAQRDYAMWRRDDARLVARASARWAYVDRARGQPQRIHDEILSTFEVLGWRMPLRPLHLPAEARAPVVQGELALTAREYETDSQQHVNNCVYGDWLGEGLYLALHAAPAMQGSQQVRPRFYQIEYVRPALPGEGMRVATRVFPRSGRGLIAQQEIVTASDGGVSVRAYSEHLRLPE